MSNTSNVKNLNPHYSVFQSIKKHKKYFIIGPLFKMVEVIFDISIPLIMKWILDQISNNDLSFNDSIKLAVYGCLIIMAMAIVGFSSTMVCQYQASVASQRVGQYLRNNLYQLILKFSNKEIDNLSTAHITTVLNVDTVMVSTGVAMFIRLAFRAPLLIIGALVISFIFSWQIALIFVGMIPIILAIVFGFMRVNAKNYQKLQSNLDDLSNRTIDTITGSRVIRAFNNEELEISKFENINDEYLKLGKNISLLNAFINPLTFAIINIVTILILVLSSINVSNLNFLGEDISATTILALVNYLDQIFVALLVVTNLVNIFTKSYTSSKRINRILQIEPSIKNKPNVIPVPGLKDVNKVLEFKDVFLSYEDSEGYVLKNINFVLNKGESLGIIGGTGSGKSSLINILHRYSEVTKGEVFYKEHIISNYELESLRKDIGVVFQKAYLFNGTIRYNLNIGKDSDLSDLDIKESLENSLSSEFVAKYENGVEEIVNEGGNNFSGGQRQRLSIASVLSSKNDMIIFDDSSSALDAISDKKLRENLYKNYKDSTKVFISQRISSIKDCDKILVLNYGEQIAFGTHEYLSKSCDLYKEIIESQELEHE